MCEEDSQKLSYCHIKFGSSLIIETFPRLCADLYYKYSTEHDITDLKVVIDSTKIEVAEMSTISEENKVNQDSVELTEPKIREWLVSYLAELLEIQADKVDVEATFARYGLDSSAAVVLAGDLENWLGKEIEPTILYDYPTIADLAQYLAK